MPSLALRRAGLPGCASQQKSDGHQLCTVWWTPTRAWNNNPKLFRVQTNNGLRRFRFPKVITLSLSTRGIPGTWYPGVSVLCRCLVDGPTRYHTIRRLVIPQLLSTAVPGTEQEKTAVILQQTSELSQNQRGRRTAVRLGQALPHEANTKHGSTTTNHKPYAMLHLFIIRILLWIGVLATPCYLAY